MVPLLKLTRLQMEMVTNETGKFAKKHEEKVSPPSRSDPAAR
jgi:hypothetical protein